MALYLGNTKISGITIPQKQIEVDDELSLESVNPVQNKVVTTALNNKSDTDLSNISSNAKTVISNNVMPKTSNFDNITPKTSGSWYTAPANGWYLINISSSGGGYAKVTWEDGFWLCHNYPSAQMNVNFTVPVSLGTKIQVNFQNGSISGFRFYYC